MSDVGERTIGTKGDHHSWSVLTRRPDRRSLILITENALTARRDKSSIGYYHARCFDLPNNRRSLQPGPLGPPFQFARPLRQAISLAGRDACGHQENR